MTGKTPTSLLQEVADKLGDLPTRLARVLREGDAVFGSRRYGRSSVGETQDEDGAPNTPRRFPDGGRPRSGSPGLYRATENLGHAIGGPFAQVATMMARFRHIFEAVKDFMDALAAFVERFRTLNAIILPSAPTVRQIPRPTLPTPPAKPAASLAPPPRRAKPRGSTVRQIPRPALPAPSRKGAPQLSAPPLGGKPVPLRQRPKVVIDNEEPQLPYRPRALPQLPYRPLGGMPETPSPPVPPKISVPRRTPEPPPSSAMKLRAAMRAESASKAREKMRNLAQTQADPVAGPGLFSSGQEPGGGLPGLVEAMGDLRDEVKHLSAALAKQGQEGDEPAGSPAHAPTTSPSPSHPAVPAPRGKAPRGSHAIDDMSRTLGNVLSIGEKIAAAV